MGEGENHDKDASSASSRKKKTPITKIERIPIAKLFPGRITSEAELEEFLAVLKAKLEKTLASGATMLLE